MSWNPVQCSPLCGSHSRMATIRTALQRHPLHATFTWQLRVSSLWLPPAFAPALPSADTKATMIPVAAADGAGSTYGSSSARAGTQHPDVGRNGQPMLDWGSATVIENRCLVL